MTKIKVLCDEIVDWLKEEVTNTGCKGVTVGLSGGIDSAVVAALAKKAFPNNTLGVIMPSHSNPEDERHARLLADKLDIDTKKIDLTKTFDTLLGELDDKGESKLAVSNIKPRLRMTTLYYFAQKDKYLVAGTGNKSEFTIGYFTKYGDSGVDLLPIVDLVKEEVRELAKFLKVPEIIITKPPSAGLWENQTDEDEMGITYKELDNYIKTGEAEESIRKKIENMKNKSEHKRRLPKKFIVSK